MVSGLTDQTRVPSHPWFPLLPPPPHTSDTTSHTPWHRAHECRSSPAQADSTRATPAQDGPQWELGSLCLKAEVNRGLWDSLRTVWPSDAIW